MLMLAEAAITTTLVVIVVTVIIIIMMSPSTMALEVTHYLLHGGITRVNG
jgi:hypothetical protein